MTTLGSRPRQQRSGVTILRGNDEPMANKYEDLREFIEQVDGLGALRRVEGADPLFEVGGIT